MISNHFELWLPTASAGKHLLIRWNSEGMLAVRPHKKERRHSCVGENQ